MRTFVSVNPCSLHDLVEATGWLPNDDEEQIADGHSNEAYVTELEDGHLQLYVDDGNDVSDILEAIGFEEQEEDDNETD
jgi:hypothetical protein